MVPSFAWMTSKVLRAGLLLERQRSRLMEIRHFTTNPKIILVDRNQSVKKSFNVPICKLASNSEL